jgi:serine/threonine-protein kinase
MALVEAGRVDEARRILGETTYAAAACDGETAYRVATFHAVAGDRDEALSWLRRAIYLGNENHPWLSANPAWRSLRGDRDFDGMLSELRQRHREAVLRWKRLSVVQG